MPSGASENTRNQANQMYFYMNTKRNKKLQVYQICTTCEIWKFKYLYQNSQFMKNARLFSCVDRNFSVLLGKAREVAIATAFQMV